MNVQAFLEVLPLAGEGMLGVFATIIVLILLFSSVQLFCIGIIGEYVGRIFEQSKDRPIYIAKEVLDYTDQ